MYTVVNCIQLTTVYNQTPLVFKISDMNTDLTSYYNDRAAEYDKVYQNPAEQADLLRATEIFQQIFLNRSVLEIACGTGYWTEQIAKVARSLVATDINTAVIDIAKTRSCAQNVHFQIADIYNLSFDQPFEGLFGGFIWSHILLQDLEGILVRLGSMLTENAEIVFIDSNPVTGTNHDKRRIYRTDGFGNTFQHRTLENGSTHEVLKNFPDKAFLTEKMSLIASDIQMVELKHYWVVKGKRKNVGS